MRAAAAKRDERRRTGFAAALVIDRNRVEEILDAPRCSKGAERTKRWVSRDRAGYLGHVA
jgi:hypothetical protein